LYYEITGRRLSDGDFIDESPDEDDDDRGDTGLVGGYEGVDGMGDGEVGALLSSGPEG